MKIAVSQKVNSALKNAFTFVSGTLALAGSSSMVDAGNASVSGGYLFDRAAPALLRIK